jgi:hypothetical protein
VEATLLSAACQLFLPGVANSADLNVRKETTRMRNATLVRSLVLASALAISVGTFAKPVAKSLAITHPVKVGQVNVKAGDYRATIDGNHLVLTNGKQIVAEADGRWEDRDTKSEYTEILSDANGKVLELRFSGQKSVFVLN